VAAVDWEGQTVLHLAAMNGHEAVARVLLHRGADAEMVGSEGETALHQAAEKGRNTVVQLLLDKGANAMATDNTG
ncbi:ankyrin, partial [Hyaloscypha bicolor E]